MKNFMVLYMASREAFEKAMRDATPEQQQKGIEAWMAWIRKSGSAIVEPGAPLGKTLRLDAKGSSDSKNEIGGYTIVRADCHADAAKLFAAGHPHLQMPGAWIEIMEIRSIPGI
jgi:hypothetical protein